MAPSASFASFSPTPPLPSSSSMSTSLRRSLSTSTSLPAVQLGVSSTKRHPLPDALTGILNSGVIACLRAQSGEMAMEAARAAIRGGISVLEIVMTTPGVLEVVRELRRDYPSCIIGILDAYNSGARIVKIYPVLVLEGARYISVLRKPFSHIPMVASQGITIDMIRTYIGSGACAVVLSDAIFEKSAMAQRNYDEIYRLASLATWQGVQAVQQTGRKFC